MKQFLVKIIILTAIIAISAQVPFGGFSDIQAFRDNIPDIIDSNFVLSSIERSADENDLDFRLEHRDERGRVRLFRDEIMVFADGKNYYIADGTHSFGAPRFRLLNRCGNDVFSYFRRVSTAPAGVFGHSDRGVNETWVILDHTNGNTRELTDRVLRQYLVRAAPLLYKEFSDRNTRNGTLIEYLRRACE